MCVYPDIQFQGRPLLVPPGLALSNLAATPIGNGKTRDLDNQISSIQPESPNPVPGNECPTS